MYRASSFTHPPFCSLFQATDLSSKAHAPLPREKLKVPPRPFPLEELSHYNHSGQLQVFFTQLEPNVHGVRQSSHVSVETNSNKRISVLGTNHTKIYRVNLVGFKHRVPARSPHKQSKYTLRSKRFSNVLTNHQGRFPKPWDRQDSQLNLETVPEAKPLTNRELFTATNAHDLTQEGFLVGRPESCVEIRHAILAKFHKPFFSNFSVAKGLGLEAFAAGRFLVGSALQSFISHFFRFFLLLQRVWALRHLRLEGFLGGSARVLRRNSTLAKFHKPFFSNFSVVVKGLGFEAFTGGRFSCRKCQSPASEFDTRFAKFHKPFFSELYCSCKT